MQAETAQSFESWHRLISGAFVPLKVESVGRPTRGGFRGTLSLSHFGGTVLTEIDSDPHTVERTEELIRGRGNGQFKISLQLSGRGLLIQDGREVLLEPGRLAVYDTSRPYTLTFDREFSSRVLMCPHDAMDIPAGRASELTATALDTLSPLGGNVADFLHQSLPTLAQLRTPIGTRLIRSSLDLLNTVFADILGPQPPVERDPQEEKLAGVLSYLDEHLADPDLTPARLAQANFISLRTLHQLFEDSGSTVAVTIRNRRLEKCRAELAAPGTHRRTVSAVGARWGFLDPAHFSRVFRNHFGLPPGEYRRRMLA